MLTRAEADDICAVVAANSECHRRIDSLLAALPAKWGISGGIRNSGMVAINMFTFGKAMDPSEPSTSAMVCVGIAEETAKSVRGAVGCRAALARLRDAGTADRDHLGTAHTATLIRMEQSSYVFDWHATLNIEDPQIYPSLVAFRNAIGAVEKSKFDGFA